MNRTIIVAAVALTMCPLGASAKNFRVQKSQQRDIAKVEARVQRSNMHPAAKRQVLTSIAEARAKIGASKYEHRNLYTSVTGGSATLVFTTGRDKATTMYLSGKDGRSFQMMKSHPVANRAFRVRAVNSSLTLSYSSRMWSKNSKFKQTTSHSLYKKGQSKGVSLSPEMWNKLNYREASE